MFVGRYDDERSKRDAIQISDITMKSRCNVNVTFGSIRMGLTVGMMAHVTYLYIGGCQWKCNQLHGNWFQELLRFLGPTKLGK